MIATGAGFSIICPVDNLSLIWTLMENPVKLVLFLCFLLYFFHFINSNIRTGNMILVMMKEILTGALTQI